MILTLKILDKFTGAELGEFEAMAQASGQDDAVIVLDLLSQLDEVIEYGKSRVEGGGGKGSTTSNLFRKLAEFFGETQPKELLLLMTRFDWGKAEDWYAVHPAIDALKALNLFAKYEVTKKVAEFEAMVYSQGGKIGEEPTANVQRGLESEPVHQLTPDNPLAHFEW